MADATSNTPISSRSKPPRAEFTFYFAIIFAAALPLALIAWAIAALRGGPVTNKGPVARAWSQARVITPMIFSA
ncbi:MAG: cytochrome PufQ [Pseudomonadota bacterium]